MEKYKIRRLAREELPVGTVALARFLIGKTLVREYRGHRLSSRLVETEAYVVGDAAAHAFRGLTPRNRSLFLDRGHAYVYFVYGCWFMLNVSGESRGVGAGVLLRAAEPLEGLRYMLPPKKSSRSCDVLRGPGRLATALHINRKLDGIDLCAPGPLWLGAAVKPAGSIGESTRIGLTVEAHRVLRFYERGNPCVSGPARLRG